MCNCIKKSRSPTNVNPYHFSAYRERNPTKFVKKMNKRKYDEKKIIKKVTLIVFQKKYTFYYFRKLHTN